MSLKFYSCSDSPDGETECNLLSVLGVAQSLNVGILPMTWQSALGVLARGGTSSINESRVNPQTSLAFKLIEEENKLKHEKYIFRTIISELGVLGNPRIRDHPNIVRLQGLGWDINESTGKAATDESSFGEKTSDKELSDTNLKVWPALVFEKSHCGDLFKFAKSQPGRELKMKDRYKLCFDIASAVRLMHSNHIVHGDIKPQNVLVFKDQNGMYIARVTDFGYSTVYAGEDDLIQLPLTRPWNAPEHDRDGRRFTPLEAQLADNFSLGMLFVWILFEPYFSGATKLPPEVETWAVGDFSESGAEDTLADLKDAGTLFEFAQRMLSIEPTLDDYAKARLEEFLSIHLRKGLNFHDLSVALLGDRPKARPQTLNEIDQVVPKSYFQVSMCLKNIMTIHIERTKIKGTLENLYQGDFRVRTYIAHCLEKELEELEELRQQKSEPVDQDYLKHISLQVALCYYIGFGVARNENKSLQILLSAGLEKSAMIEASVQPTEMHYETMDARKAPATLVLGLSRQGYLYTIDFGTYHLEQGNAKEAEKQLLQDIDGMNRSLGKVSYWRHLNVALSSIYFGQERWEECFELKSRILEWTREKMGVDDPNTLTEMHDLATIYDKQGRWKQAEKLYEQVVEASKRVLGADHPSTMLSVKGLGRAYKGQGRWEEAEKLYLEVLEHMMRTLGPEHPNTLGCMDNISTLYQEQERWRESEEIQKSVVKVSKKVLGSEHPDTLQSIHSLAVAYSGQRQYEEAVMLLKQLVEIRTKIFGADHPSVLRSKEALDDAEECRESLECEELILTLDGWIAATEELGQDNPETLTRLNHFALTLKASGRHNEAIQAMELCVSLRTQRLGANHPETIFSSELLQTWNMEHCAV